MLKRFLERQAGPSMEPPSGPALTEDELKAGLLREVDLFAGLDASELKEISQTLPMRTCQVGGLVISPDDADERLYVVKRGRVRLYRITPDGKQLTLEILDKGRIVGRMSMLGQQLTDAYAEAIEDTLICSFTPQELQRLMVRFPSVGVNIIRYLSGRLAVSEREREVMAFRSVEQRLAARLVELVERFGQAAEDGTAIDARLTQQELADMIGTSRETLATTVAALRHEGVLDMNNQRVVIRDLQRIRELAGR